MRVIVGLGNPGKEYEHTRHNIGFQILDRLAHAFQEAWHLSAWVEQKKHRALVAEGHRGSEKIILAKPQTFMNLSGTSVASLLSWHTASPQQLIVVHDDLDLPFGEIRMQNNRGPAGHNGVRSLIETLGTKEFWRIRFGIGRNLQVPSDAYVLQKFSTLEKMQLRSILNQLPQTIEKQFFT